MLVLIMFILVVHLWHAGVECGHQAAVEGQQVGPGPVHREQGLHKPLSIVLSQIKFYIV